MGILLVGLRTPAPRDAAVRSLRLTATYHTGERHLKGDRHIEHVKAAGLEGALVTAHVDHTGYVAVDFGSHAVLLHIGSAAAGNSECVVPGVHMGSAMPV